jgi:hypothetical protein
MLCRVASWTSTQYGQVFASDTADATDSFMTRGARPDASSVSRIINQLAAMTSGDGECSVIGGARKPYSRSICR